MSNLLSRENVVTVIIRITINLLYYYYYYYYGDGASGSSLSPLPEVVADV